MQEKYLQEDEIDLRELFKTILDKKVFIVIFTLVITILAAIYAYNKTPIYEAKALIEIGEYKVINVTDKSTSKVFIDDVANLEKKLTTLYVDMFKNIEDKTSEITNINVSKGLKNFLEIKSEAISNEEAKNEITKVLSSLQTEHEKIINDIKNQKELELKAIQTQIFDIKTKSVSLIDVEIEGIKKLLDKLNEQLQTIDDSLKKNENLSLITLKLMEKKDISDSINNLISQKFELESKKDELLTTSLYKLEDQKRTIELLLLPHNYKNTQIVGEIMTNDFPAKPKKSLIVAVAFVTGFILSIFLVFVIQFIQGTKKES
ncbi:Wzz/FepE/Etk N-terminal domain-containing protein [Aliarcobacter cryaerophilus]|uniref:Wzz/FepE/Etk N-terminal domain-containing protein n=1 Tax=Aliarcobacter cryaerophilus TaxID=28198 RepID=UPI0021B20B53|nr:Wzz/FepE/Etk N-terminal domain-containing protein [Aliarcobacter cryaerophilus]MCT7505100.1 Wzz/FepE/Etk N-terminal domain-containing protein [Aliarcobacter cryaerophilus]